MLCYFFSFVTTVSSVFGVLVVQKVDLFCAENAEHFINLFINIIARINTIKMCAIMLESVMKK